MPNPSSFVDYEHGDDDSASKEGKENREKGDAGWEKTEDFNMEPSGCGVMVRPYKLPGSIFKILCPQQREGLRWLWVLHHSGPEGSSGMT